MPTYLYIEDHDIVRAGLRTLVSLMGGGVTLLEASTLAEGLAILEANPVVDLIVLDANLPDSTGLDGLKILKERFPDLIIVMMSGCVEGDFMLQALSAGAAGFIPKTAMGDRLRAALALVQSGQKYIPEELIDWMPRVNAKNGPGEAARMGDGQPLADADGVNFSTKMQSILDKLTERQIQVAKLLAQGYSNKEICRDLGLSLGTVKNHVAAVLNALGTNSRFKVIHLFSEHPDFSSR